MNIQKITHSSSMKDIARWAIDIQEENVTIERVLFDMHVVVSLLQKENSKSFSLENNPIFILMVAKLSKLSNERLNFWKAYDQARNMAR